MSPKLDRPATATVLAAPTQFNMTKADVDKFASTICRVRDILRRISITGMDSLRQICIYLMSRSLTLENVSRFGVPDQFAWENIIAVKNGDGGEEKALECFNNPTTDCLLNHFDRLFGTHGFQFDLKPANRHHRLAHMEILDIFDGVNLTNVDMRHDIMGWVYEQHLKTGSSSANRDIGQFFTDRDLCNFLVRLCAPRIKASGALETVCDPTMGTAGFLTAALKYYSEKAEEAGTPINWTAQLKQLHGCDTDDRVAGVARLNIFLESHGQSSDTLLTHNSLYDDLPLTGYDVILANMPFGLKGLKHAECCKRVKDLRINGTKSEPLFLQLIMVSLNPGGRCAVVVPDGMLVNVSKCHNGTRKYLLDHFELRRVIKMKGEFFMNTGIRPSILFFENTGKPTSVVEFWEAEKDGAGGIKETLIVTADREEFGEDCAFDMRRFMDDTNTVASSAGFPMVALGDIVSHKNGKNIPEKNRLETGPFPYYASNGINGFVESYIFEGPAALVGDQGSIKTAQFVEEGTKFYAGNHTLVMQPTDPATLNIKFLYYYLKLTNLSSYFRTTALIPELDKSRFVRMEIPLPPLAIQEHIVAELDTVYSPVISATTLVPILQHQMVAIVKTVGRRGFPVAPLGEILSDFAPHRIVSTKDADGGEFNMYSSGCVVMRHSVAEFSGRPYIIQGSRGTISNATHYCATPFSVANNVFVLAEKDASVTNLKFVYYMLRLCKYADSVATTSVIPMLTKTKFREISIPLPPLAVQEDIVSRLDSLQAIIDSTTLQQKQIESNAKFVLDSYLAAAPAADADGSDATTTTTTTASSTITAIGGAGIDE